MNKNKLNKRFIFISLLFGTLLFLATFANLDQSNKVSGLAVTNTQCNGCLKDGKCVPTGVRLEEEGISKFCSQDFQLNAQKLKSESCQFDYECQANSCIDGECKSIKEELEETRGILQRIIDWTNIWNPCDKGCYLNDECIDVGRILFVVEDMKYCAEDGEFYKLKPEGACTYRYECTTYGCNSGQCAPLRDTYPPRIMEIIVPETVTSDLVISAKIKDDYPLNYAKATFNNKELILKDDGLGNDELAQDDIYTGTFDPTNLAEGNYVVTIEAEDKKGNKIQETGPFFTKGLQDNCFPLEIEGRENQNDNINIIFMGIGLDKETLTYASKTFIDYNSQGLGLFAVEPFKSNKEKFNFWYIDSPNFEIRDAYFLTYNSYLRNKQIKQLTKLCEKENSYVYAIANISGTSYQWGGNVVMSGIGHNNFAQIDDIIPNYDSKANWQRLFTHESGHLLGKLIDEYYYASVQTRTQYNIYNNPEIINNNIGEFGLTNKWYNDCLESVPWKDFIGYGCGEPGVIDCLKTDQYGKPTCDGADKRCHLEVGCWTISPDEGSFRATYRDAINTRDGDPFEFNPFNQYLICKQLKEKSNDIHGVCDDLCSIRDC